MRQQSRDAIVEAVFDNDAPRSAPGHVRDRAAGAGRAALPAVPRDGGARRRQRCATCSWRRAGGWRIGWCRRASAADGQVPIVGGVKPGEQVVAELTPDVRDGAEGEVRTPCSGSPASASAARLRDGAHPGHRRRRHRRLQASWASTASPTSTCPIVTVITAPARRRARGGRDRGHRQDRGGGQHHQRHRRAALDLDRGRVAGRSSAFQLDKDVDVAAQEVRDHVSTVLPDLPEGIEEPGDQQARSRTRRRCCSWRCESRAPDPRGDRGRRHEVRAGARERARASARSPSSAAASGRSRWCWIPSEAARRRPDRRRRAARHRGPEPHHAGRRRRHRARSG